MRRPRHHKSAVYPNLEKEIWNAGLNYTAIAEALYMTPGNVHQLLSGARILYLDTAKRIRDVVAPGKTLDYLFEK